jgi:hypothetical protein
MRRAPTPKTSPRTPALPGFGVSGVCKMRGLIASTVSFERVQMGGCRPELGGGLEAAPTGMSRGLGAVRLGSARDGVHLNAFKWKTSGWVSTLRVLMPMGASARLGYARVRWLQSHPPWRDPPESLPTCCALQPEVDLGGVRRPSLLRAAAERSWLRSGASHPDFDSFGLPLAHAPRRLFERVQIMRLVRSMAAAVSSSRAAGWLLTPIYRGGTPMHALK